MSWERNQISKWNFCELAEVKESSDLYEFQFGKGDLVKK